MGLAGYIIGGAMQGLGQGMALKQRAEDEDRRAELAERRAVAMENLRSQNLAGREAANNEAIKEREALNADRQFSNAKTLKGLEYQYASGLGDRKAKAEVAGREDQQAHDISKIYAEAGARIKEYNATHPDEIHSVETDEVTGALSGITKSGQVINLSKKGAIARKLPKASASGEMDSYLTGRGPVKPGAVPALPPGFVLEK